MFLKKDESRYMYGCVHPEELAGVKKKSFILPYAGGEIWFEHLDGIYQYTEFALEKLRGIRRLSVVHPHRLISPLSSMKR